MEDMPPGVALHVLARVALTREQPILRLGRPERRRNPFLQGCSGAGMDDHRVAGSFAFAILAVEVEARQNFLAVVDLAHAQAQ